MSSDLGKELTLEDAKERINELEEAEIPAKMAEILAELVDNYLDTCSEESNKHLDSYRAASAWLQGKFQ